MIAANSPARSLLHHLHRPSLLPGAPAVLILAPRITGPRQRYACVYFTDPITPRPQTQTTGRYMPAVPLALLLLFTSSSAAFVRRAALPTTAAFGLAASPRTSYYSRRLLATMASADAKPQVTFVTGNAKKLEVSAPGYKQRTFNGVGHGSSRVADGTGLHTEDRGQSSGLTS